MVSPCHQGCVKGLSLFKSFLTVLAGHYGESYYNCQLQRDNASCSAVKVEEELAHLKAKVEDDLVKELEVLSIEPGMQKLLDEFYANIDKDTEPVIIGEKCVSEFSTGP
jgi:hypothetical protein